MLLGIFCRSSSDDDDDDDDDILKDDRVTGDGDCKDGDDKVNGVNADINSSGDEEGDINNDELEDDSNKGN